MQLRGAVIGSDMTCFFKLTRSATIRFCWRATCFGIIYLQTVLLLFLCFLIPSQVVTIFQANKWYLIKFNFIYIKI
jgi:hypothetical protein